jgi:threonine dehydrogenase-like Zn-dependent dehydrogenase
MRALTLIPGRPGSARLEQVPEPSPADGAILVQAHAIGVCGTDREILDGRYGQAPPGKTRLVLGHESIGRVLQAPASGTLREGDWVAGIVRRPDPVPCSNCAVGEWDMCRNGRFTERGIKGRHGFASERYRLEPEFAVRVDSRLGELGVLVEPASVLAKAWEHIDRIGRRALFEPERVLVTGAGPIGLLAALFGVQRGLSVHVLDRHTEGPKPALVADLGAVYHVGGVAALCSESDIVLECTGAHSLVFDAIEAARANGIVCLTGVSSGGRTVPIDVGALNREALRKADRSWLERLITRKVPLEGWRDALTRRPSDVKPVIVFGDSSS